MTLRLTAKVCLAQLCWLSAVTRAAALEDAATVAKSADFGGVFVTSADGAVCAQGNKLSPTSECDCVKGTSPLRLPNASTLSPSGSATMLFACLRLPL